MTTTSAPLPAARSPDSATVLPLADSRPGARGVDPRAGGRLLLWAYDPGQQGALAVLEVAHPRPRLLWSCALAPRRGDDVAAHRAALVGLCDAAVAVAGVPDHAVVELPAAGGKSRGGVRALSLGHVQRDAGWWAGYVTGRWSAQVHELEGDVWTRAVQVPAGKQPGVGDLVLGWHRVGEATVTVDTTAAPLVLLRRASKVEQARVVARAEAALLGAAAIRLGVGR